MKPPTARPSALLLIPASAGLLLVAVPVIGLLQRAPWSSLLDRLTSDTVLDAIQVSITVSVTAAIIATVLGLPLAWLLARHDGRLATLVRAAVLVPMVLPPVVGGTALLFALGRRGLVGQWLDSWFGSSLWSIAPISHQNRSLKAPRGSMTLRQLSAIAIFSSLERLAYRVSRSFRALSL